MTETPTYWMIVTSPQNFARTRELGFTLQGIKSRHGKKAAKMKAGDRLLWYLTGIQAFPGTATITGPAYEDHEIVWTSKPGEDYPWRFPIRPETVLDAENAIKAADLLPGLQFVKKWPIEHWHLAFQGNVHTLPEEDFTFIEGELQRAAQEAA